MNRFRPIALWLFPLAWSVALWAVCPARAADVYLPCAPEPTDMSIHPGDIINCAIDPIGDSDLFRFEGIAGQTMQLTLTDTTPFGGHPLAELYDPEQTLIHTLVHNDGGTRLLMTVPESGTYSLLLREDGEDQVATYILALQTLFPPPAEAVSLCAGCTYGGAINVIGDSDVVLFDGQAGHTVMLTLNDSTPFGGHPVAELFDPDGDAIDSLVINDGGLRQLRELEKTGTYTVFLRESGDDQVATYSFSRQDLFPLSAATECLAYGSVRSDQINPVTDSDLLKFSGAAGGTIRLTLTDTTAFGAHPVLEVFDPNEVLVTTLANNDGAASWQTTLTETGDYALLIREDGDDQVATYNLALQCVFGPCVDCTTLPVEAVTWGRLKSKYR